MYYVMILSQLPRYLIRINFKIRVFYKKIINVLPNYRFNLLSLFKVKYTL